MTHPLFQDNEARENCMQNTFNFRDKPLAHELKEAEKRRNKQRLQRLLLEYRISEYNKQQQQEVDRARIVT